MERLKQRRALRDSSAELRHARFVVLIAKNDGGPDAHSEPAAHRTTVSART